MDDLSSKLDGSDLERNESSSFFKNNTVNDFSWRNLTVTVKDRHTKQPRNLMMESAGQFSKVGGYFPELYVSIPDEHPINSTNE